MNPRETRNEKNNEPRVNRRIRMREVFVIDDAGSKIGVIATEEALRRAEEKGLDLVEINPNARPPVCKIMDYGKYKYEQKRHAAEQRRNSKQVDVKEIKFTPSTGDHDFETKVRHLREFLADGDKARITVRFSGREMAHLELGQKMLKRVQEAVADIAQVEFQPRLEGKNMFMLLAPGKAQAKAKSAVA